MEIVRQFPQQTTIRPEVFDTTAILRHLLTKTLLEFFPDVNGPSERDKALTRK